MLYHEENRARVQAGRDAERTSAQTKVTTVSDNAYWRLAKREKRPNPLRDLSEAWESLGRLADAKVPVRNRISCWADSKGFTLGTLERMNVRYRTNRHGGVVLAYALRCDHASSLPGGTICGIKYRDIDPAGSKWCEPGTRFSYPAMPPLHGPKSPTRIFVTEGESDAAWLLERAQETDAVYCLHGGAGLWCAEWALPLDLSGAEIYVATDNDWDRRDGNIGEELADRVAGDLASPSNRLRPPFPARDWCEVLS